MFSVSRPFRKFCTQATSIPGLRFIPNFLDTTGQQELLKQSLQLHSRILESAKNKPKTKAQTYLSQQHNLKSEEYYKLLHLQNPNDTRLACQHFEKYGEDGHKLTYFIGNNNIPPFVKDKLIASMEKLEEVLSVQSNKQKAAAAAQSTQNLKTQDPASLNWNFTFNAYSLANINAQVVAGFPFHIDVASNGQVTAIFTLISSAKLEMRKKGTIDPSHSIVLTPGSLFLLSGESRWNWEHRVVPKSIQEGDQPIELPDSEPISRMSLVLGCL